MLRDKQTRQVILFLCSQLVATSGFVFGFFFFTELFVMDFHRNCLKATTSARHKGRILFNEPSLIKAIRQFLGKVKLTTTFLFIWHSGYVYTLSISDLKSEWHILDFVFYRYFSVKLISVSVFLSRMQQLAKELSVVIPVSFFEEANNAHYNSIAIIDADGSDIGLYRKSHIPDGPGRK